MLSSVFLPAVIASLLLFSTTASAVDNNAASPAMPDTELAAAEQGATTTKPPYQYPYFDPHNHHYKSDYSLGPYGEPYFPGAGSPPPLTEDPNYGHGNTEKYAYSIKIFNYTFTFTGRTLCDYCEAFDHLYLQYARYGCPVLTYSFVSLCSDLYNDHPNQQLAGFQDFCETAVNLGCDVLDLPLRNIAYRHDPCIGIVQC